LSTVGGMPVTMRSLLVIVSQNGLFWCTLGHCFKLNVFATEGLKTSFHLPGQLAGTYLRIHEI